MGSKRSTIDCSKEGEVRYIIENLHASADFYKAKLTKLSKRSLHCMWFSLGFMLPTIAIPSGAGLFKFLPLAFQISCLLAFAYFNHKETKLRREWSNYMDDQQEYIKAVHE